MNVHTYPNAAAFLEKTEALLEADESTNNLMLGLCLRLKRHPERIRIQPCYKTVESPDGLQVAALMTPPHKLILYRQGSGGSAALHILAENLIADGGHVPGVLGPAEVAEQFAQVWARLTGGKIRPGKRERIYVLRKVISPRQVPGKLRPAMESDLDLVSRWMFSFNMEAFGAADWDESRQRAQERAGDGDMFLWDDGQPVSMAARTRPTRHGISIGPVYTPPEMRRRGYASACVAGLSQLMLDSGREFCNLFTDLTNPTANHIYQDIGYEPVCDFHEYNFPASQPEPG